MSSIGDIAFRRLRNTGFIIKKDNPGSKATPSVPHLWSFVSQPFISIVNCEFALAMLNLSSAGADTKASFLLVPRDKEEVRPLRPFDQIASVRHLDVH